MSGGRLACLGLATAIVAAGALAVALSGGGQERASVDAGDQHAAGAVHRERARRFTVTVPPGWHRARERVIRHVTNPREILVVSTFSLESAGEPCGPFYDHLLSHMRPREAFIAVQERLGRSVAGPPEFPPRPKRFRLALQTPERRGCGRNPERRLVRAWWLPFRDAGRDFYAQVAIGLAAPDHVRRDAVRVLDSLRFTRRGVSARIAPLGAGGRDARAVAPR